MTSEYAATQVRKMDIRCKPHIDIHSSLVTCKKFRFNTELSGKLLSKAITDSARKCEKLCQGKRNKCAGWSWLGRYCQLFTIINGKPRRKKDSSSGFCEGSPDEFYHQIINISFQLCMISKLLNICLLNLLAKLV